MKSKLPAEIVQNNLLDKCATACVNVHFCRQVNYSYVYTFVFVYEYGADISVDWTLTTSLHLSRVRARGVNEPGEF